MFWDVYQTFLLLQVTFSKGLKMLWILSLRPLPAWIHLETPCLSGHTVTRRGGRNYSVFSESAALMAQIHLQFILNSLREAFKFIPIHWWLCPAMTQHMVLLVFFVFVQWNIIAMQIREEWLPKHLMFSRIQWARISSKHWSAGGESNI